MASWSSADMQRYAQQRQQHQQQQQQPDGSGYRPSISMDQLNSHDHSYLTSGTNGNAFSEQQVGRNSMSILNMDDSQPSSSNRNISTPQPAQPTVPSQPPLISRDSPSQNNSTPLRANLQTQLDALLKTQTDVIAYLQVELERRRDWEDRVTKEMHQRHVVLTTLMTNLMPVAKGMDDSPNGGNGTFMSPASMGNIATTRASDILARTLQSSQNTNGLSGLHNDPNQLKPLPTMQSDALMSHIASTTLPNIAGRMGNNTIQLTGDPNKSNRGMLPDPTAATFAAFGSYDPMKQAQQRPTQDQNLMNGYANGGDESFTSGRAASQKATPSRSSKRKRREGSASSDEGRGGVEVDERGVIYMANGKKTDSRPAKIQSLVRKSIQAAMGMTNGKRTIPAYEEGMQPPDGSGEWRFGNLRFDWDKTPRQSPHNAQLKEVVLNHIAISRNEYPSIPEGDFAPGRLDHSFDQAFTTWRGKFRSQQDAPKDNAGNTTLGDG